jgi:hypothetical protein
MLVSDNISQIYNFLTAYDFSEVKAALKRFAIARKNTSPVIHDGVLEWTEDGRPGKGYEWTEINGKVLYWPVASPPRTQARTDRKPPKTDTSIAPVPLIGCPDCGGGMYKEGICPGCEDGKKGYRIRLLCGECDRTILL